jgi:FixJ family two-component response regulator
VKSVRHASTLAGSDFQRLPDPASSFEGYWGGETPSGQQAVVYVLDPDPRVQDRLRSLLTSAGLEVRSYRALKLLVAVPPADLAGCVVADARLLLNGYIVEPEPLTELGLHLPVIVTAPEPDVALAVHAMKAGAADFLAKPFHEQELLTAIRSAIEADRLRRAAEAERRAIHRLYATLTGRERQVVALVTAGRMNKQVAWELGVSEITVKVHRGSAMRKMAARTLPDLIRMMESISAEGSISGGQGAPGSR